MSKYIYGANSLDEAKMAEEILQLLIPMNYKQLNIERAIQLLKECPCMSWLLQIFELNPNKTLQGAISDNAEAGHLLSHGLLIMWIPLDRIPIEMTEVAASNGCPLSQCIMYKKTGNRYWAQLAADQHYSEGLFKVGRYEEAVDMGGWINAMLTLEENATSDVEAWYWRARAQLAGFETKFHNVREYESKCQLGYMLPELTECRQCYLDHCRAYRRIVDTWSIVATRMGMSKDIRILIAKILWKWRVYRVD